MSSYTEDLDAALVADGEEFILRRVIGVQPQTNIDVVVVGKVRSIIRRDLILAGGITQDFLEVVMSKTQILAAQWPGGGIDAAEPNYIDRSNPKKGDKAIIKGATFNVELVQLI